MISFLIGEVCPQRTVPTSPSVSQLHCCFPSLRVRPSQTVAAEIHEVNIDVIHIRYSVKHCS